MPMNKITELLDAIVSTDTKKFKTCVENLSDIRLEITSTDRELSFLSLELKRLTDENDQLKLIQDSNDQRTKYEIEQCKSELQLVQSQYQKSLIDLNEQLTLVTSLKSQLSTVKSTDQTDNLLRRLSDLDIKCKGLQLELEKYKSRPTFEDEVISLRQKIAAYEVQIKNLQSNDRLTSELEKSNTRIESIAQENASLRTLLTTKDATIKDLTTELGVMKSKPRFTEEDRRSLESKIESLQAQLQVNNASEISYPIITEPTLLSCDTTIVIKEIKPAIYMNSLIEYVMNSFSLYNKTSKGTQDKFLLVLDPMVDENRILKYRKHGFPINELSTDYDYPMLITNKGEVKINQIVDFSKYKTVVIIDRYGRLDTAVRKIGADVYYLVDSPTDIVDYNLSRTKCIAFFHQQTASQAIATKIPCKFRYTVDPVLPDSVTWDPKLGITYMMTSVEFVERILCND